MTKKVYKWQEDLIPPSSKEFSVEIEIEIQETVAQMTTNSKPNPKTKKILNHKTNPKIFQPTTRIIIHGLLNTQYPPKICLHHWEIKHQNIMNITIMVGTITHLGHQKEALGVILEGDGHPTKTKINKRGNGGDGNSPTGSHPLPPPQQYPRDNGEREELGKEGERKRKRDY